MPLTLCLSERSIIPYFRDKKLTLQDLEKHPKYIKIITNMS